MAGRHVDRHEGGIEAAVAHGDTVHFGNVRLTLVDRTLADGGDASAEEPDLELPDEPARGPRPDRAPAGPSPEPAAAGGAVSAVSADRLAALEALSSEVEEETADADDAG